MQPPLTKCQSSIDMHGDMYLPTQPHMQPSITDFQCSSGVDNRLALDSIPSSTNQMQIATATTTTSHR